MTRLTVYVPAGEDTFGIVPGSAIVGSPDQDLAAQTEIGQARPMVRVDYEGGRFNPEYFAAFDNRLLHAADRHVTNYPTIARSWISSQFLAAVGTYDPDTHALEVSDQAALDAWVALWRPR